MTENERLRVLFTDSRFRTQKEFADHIGIQSGSLSDIIRGKEGVGVSRSLKKKLESRLNVNISWLETGIGEQYNEGHTEAQRGGGVPMYGKDLSTSGNFLDGLPDFFVNFLPFNDCTAYLSVYGDSMYPRYASGEIIAIKQIYNHDVILWGEAYLIITDTTSNSLKMIKNVFEHPDASKLTLRSSNPNFKGETVILRSNIHALYIIKGKITRNIL